ncbi:MAG: hypothetical protein WCY93_10685 [Anaerolineaceae bacterium]
MSFEVRDQVRYTGFNKAAYAVDGRRETLKQGAIGIVRHIGDNGIYVAFEWPILQVTVDPKELELV